MGEALAELVGAVIEGTVGLVTSAVEAGGSVLHGAGEVAAGAVEGAVTAGSGASGSTAADRREPGPTGLPRSPG
jgi:hypothetical protein